MDIEQGASIIVNDWAQLRREQVLHFITDQNHKAEAEAIRHQVELIGAYPKITILPADEVQSGKALERFSRRDDPSDVIVGATEYSFVTTDAVKRALDSGSHFISLPLSTTDCSSMLTRPFIAMDCRQAGRMAAEPIRRLNMADDIHVTTALGTDLRLTKAGRKAFCFTGLAAGFHHFASASFEICVPIEEYTASGTLVVDGSLGYIGKVATPIHITLEQGRMTSIEANADGRRLQAYLDGFDDPEMARAAEFGIGLNRLAHCDGIAYIEDESSYGTFHIGFGRNVALGGTHQAKGHFDLVTRGPDITAGNLAIMTKGELI